MSGNVEMYRTAIVCVKEEDWKELNDGIDCNICEEDER